MLSFISTVESWDVTNIFSAISWHPLHHPSFFLFSSPHTQYVNQSLWLVLSWQKWYPLDKIANALLNGFSQHCTSKVEVTYINSKPAFSLQWLYWFLFPTDQNHRLKEILKGRVGKYEKEKTPQERDEVLVERHGTLPWRFFSGKLKLTYYL